MKGSDDTQIREDDRSSIRKTSTSPEVSPETTAYRAAKHDAMGENHSDTTEMNSSKTTPKASKTKDLKTGRMKNNEALGSHEHGRATKSIVRPIEFVENDVKMDNW